MGETIFGVLSDYESVVEVGVGNRPDLAVRLAEAGVSMTVTDVSVDSTDIVERETPSGLEFVVDDVTAPDLGVYEGADAVVAQRLPPELQQPVVEVADAVGAACFFTTLGGDPAVVPVTPRTVEFGTLFEARNRR